jgi:LacI family gluconate utilization system Gnt-I transcriptional repressor
MKQDHPSARSIRQAGDAVTLKHVAERAGVSPITVSRALNKPDTVSKTLRAQVEQAVEDLGYVQNRVAGALASAETRVIPVVVPSLSNAVFVETIQGIQDVIHPAGYQLLLGNTEYDLDQEHAWISTFLGWSPPGLIVAGTRHLDRTISLLKRWGKPIAEIMEYDARSLDLNVGLSHYEAGEAMGEHLIGRGYRQIGYVGCNIKADYRAWQRFKGLDRILAKAGLNRHRPVNLDEPSSAALGGQALIKLLAEKPELDALFFANDDLAVGAVLRAQRDGVKVPERVAIAGFNGLGLAELVTPALTTIASPRREIGRLAAEKLLMRIRGQTSMPKRVNVGFDLVVREST